MLFQRRQKIKLVRKKRKGLRRGKGVELSHAVSVGGHHNYVSLQHCGGGPRAPPDILICGCSVADPVGQTTSLPIRGEKGTSSAVIGAREHCRALHEVSGRSETPQSLINYVHSRAGDTRMHAGGVERRGL